MCSDLFRVATLFGMAACLVFAPGIASTDAFAGAKDESAAEWLAPKWFNEWHDGLAQ
jgi:porin